MVSVVHGLGRKRKIATHLIDGEPVVDKAGERRLVLKTPTAA